MKENCAKCKEKTEGERCRLSEGKVFFFCKFCDEFIEDHPHLSVRDFIGPRFDSYVSRNIREAHKKRSQGQSPWNPVDK
jgi:hypothetical protein